MYIPNSYDFFWNTSAENFRNKMWSYYQSFWTDNRKKKAADQGLSSKEVIILAAIVQKETQKVDERHRVAGVYLNRLKREMKLQADPTVIYAMKLKFHNFDTIIKRVLHKDLKIKSVYNTYKHWGLPPGPITRPIKSFLISKDCLIKCGPTEQYTFGISSFLSFRILTKLEIIFLNNPLFLQQP